ncbi:MAG: S-methyl-5-thioribose-1-phosphate isomerase [Bacteriovoracia bacterium]
MKNVESLGLKVENNVLSILDQQKLPHEEVWVESNTPDEMVSLIKRLAVRGAPLIGVAAALSLAKYAEDGASVDQLIEAAQKLRNARPTAVNLMMAVDRTVLEQKRESLTKQNIVRIAEEIFAEDVELCEKMANVGEPLIEDGDSILTHCNTGGLATVGIGTALGVIRRAFENGKKIHVYVDETRPLLQGARLTTWELNKLRIPFTLISDNMAGMLMAQGKIQKVFTGADRVAKNGDSANKIGTYSVAVLAKHHKIPFYIVAPSTTLDVKCVSGKEIPIEQREGNEVRSTFALKNCEVYNPAFDVTPRELITALVLDTGLVQ